MITGAGITADRLSECLMGAEMLFHQKYCENCSPLSDRPYSKAGWQKLVKMLKSKSQPPALFISFGA